MLLLLLLLIIMVYYRRWEEVAQARLPGDRRDGMLRLLAELPECNRVLVQWVFVHMGHVIAQEKMNKMTLQNVSIVLSPTMRISHRYNRKQQRIE